MSKLFFADNTVLINFALLDRMALLARLSNGRAAWSSVVRGECLDSAAKLDSDPLRGAELIFGEPVRMTNPETVRQVLTLTDRLRGPGENQHLERARSKHQGEAETMALIVVEHSGSLFVTDDAGSRAVARDLRIPTVSTCQLLRMAVRAGLLPASTAWEAVCLLRRLGRTLHDSPRDEPQYMRWCTAA